MRVAGALALCCSLLALPAQAQPDAPAPPPAAPAPSEAAPADAAEAPEASAAPQRYYDTADTRGQAMRAYLKALDAKKLSASAPLSIQRLRDELPVIEE